MTATIVADELLVNVHRQPDDLTQSSVTIPMTYEQATGLRDFLIATT